MDSIPIFTMLVGLPASGKSTYAQELAKEYNNVLEISKNYTEHNPVAP